jgi:trk system potassium uptake protein TrkA
MGTGSPDSRRGAQRDFPKNRREKNENHEGREEMKIVVIGCGRMGSGIALNLARQHHQVVVVDTDLKAFERLGPSFAGTMLEGSALDQEMFNASGVSRADGLAAVTGDDTINTVVARAAKQIFRVPKVVARIHDPLNAEVYRRLGIQTVTNVSLGIARISDLLTFSHLDILHSLGNGEVSIVTFEIPVLLSGHTAADITVPGEILVVSLTRNGKTTIPATGTVFQTGDLLHIAVEKNSASRLRSLLKYL